MARNIFDLRSVLPVQRLSVKEVSLTLLSMLMVLKQRDEIFSRFKVSELNFERVGFDLNVEDFDSALLKLSETLLRFHLSDIQKFEKESSPTIDYKRNLGYMFLLEFESNGNKRFVISGNLGTASKSEWNTITVQNFSIERSDYDFDWYFNILKSANDFLSPVYSSVRIILDQYMEAYWSLKIKYPLGWITYFSDDSKIKTPDDIGFEVLKVEGGCYIIATRNDFTQSKEEFLEIKDKLIEATKKLKKYSPEYSEG